MSTKPVSSSGIERQWFERVRGAEAHYQQALEHQKRMIEGLNKALMEPASDTSAVEQANRAAKLALDDLVKRQGVLVDLVLNISPGAERS
jgi:hypothetical protein